MASVSPTPDQAPPVIQWDTEDRIELTSPKEGHIRLNMMYVTAALWAEMQEAWGGVVAYIKTATDTETGEVTVAKATENEKGAVPVRPIGALNTAEFSFFRPLRKLKLKVPANRQVNVAPFTKEIPTVGTVFVFPMAQRVSLPRNRKEESDSQNAAPVNENGSKVSTEGGGI